MSWADGSTGGGAMRESTSALRLNIIGADRTRGSTRAVQFETRTGDIMGKGDARTRKGKIFKGSYGKSRPHKVKKGAAAAPGAAKAPARRPA